MGVTVAATPMPYSDLAERSLLGAALWDLEAAELVALEVEPEDFYVPAHAAVARAVRGLVLGGERVTAEAVALDLEHEDGGHSSERRRWLVDMQVDGSSAKSARRFAGEIWDCAARRRVLTTAREVVDNAQNLTVPFDAVAEGCHRLRDLAEVPVASSAPDPDAAEFLAQHDEYDWVIPGLLERQDRLMVTGEEGQGKSTLLRQLAVCAAAGIGMFGVGTTTPRKVLILDCENGRAQVRRSLRGLVAASSRDGRPPAEGMLRICCRPDGLDLASRADIRFVHERILADHPEIIVMGPLYKLVNASPIEEEPAKKVSRTLDTLRDRYGVTLVIEAHSPHGIAGARETRPYGASLWKRWPEFGLGLVRQTDDPHAFDVKHWRGPREERAWPKLLRRGGAWPWTAPTSAQPQEIF